jgi:hypothetical protein
MLCPVWALGQCYLHLRHNGAMAKTFLSAYFLTAHQRSDINNEDITTALKTAVTALDYPKLTRIHYGEEVQMHYL